MKELIFISSVQKELADERKVLRDFILGNRLFSRYFDVFLFEDLPAKDRRPDNLYLDKVDECSIFLALYAKEYGWEDPKDGISPTEREFNLATDLSKHRLIFLRNVGNGKLHPKMEALTTKAKNQLTYKRFSSSADLTSLVYNSLIEYLEDRCIIQNKPFDAAVCPGATLSDVSTEKIRWFLRTARQERNLNLSTTASPEQTLTHLKILEDGKLSNAAVLLFSRDPQKCATSAVVKCALFHGLEVAKPIPSHQVFEGTLFDQVDSAVDFVMGKLDRTVGTRKSGARAPVKYEVPKEAVAEIIVNAVAHRDYTSSASVQVFVFSDRIEVSNPGRLPKGLTPEHLTKPHSSEPANPLIARPLYLAHYIESLGTGTLDVIRLFHEANLPAPEFAQRGNQFVVTLWRDWLTEDALNKLDITDRQREAVQHVKKAGKITNSEYQDLVGVARKTAARDLDGLVEKGVLDRIGAKRGAHYVLAGRK
ncbi:MAG: ATP-binding protein [Dehalococcoidia bacterium]|nr:ATP-binding protein [Dehalococcoidia bacterium]